MVDSKGYWLLRNGQYFAQFRIEYDGNVLEIEWEKPFKTKKECIDFITSHIDDLVGKVCSEIGLEIEGYAGKFKASKTLH